MTWSKPTFSHCVRSCCAFHMLLVSSHMFNRTVSLFLVAWLFIYLSMLLSSGRSSVITRRLFFPHKDCFFAMPVFFWSQTRKWCPLSILRVSRSVSLSNHTDEFISMKKCVVKGFTLPAMRCVYTYKHAQCT